MPRRAATAKASPAPQLRDRILELRRIPAAELRANPKNWRLHPERQRQAITAVLEEVGFVAAIIARETFDGIEIIDGHLRTEVSGEELVPVLIVDLNDHEAATILATFDPISAMAETDAKALAALIKNMEEQGTLLHKYVFEDHFLDPIAQAKWADPQEDGEQPEKPSIALTVEDHEIVKAAVSRLRAEEGYDDITEGRALELICADFLAGVNT
jgi:hypothetical protein